MSLYPVDKVCFRVVHDPELRAALQADPVRVLRAATPPLTDEQIEAFAAGDVGRLSLMGADHFLLHQLGRFELLGLDLPIYAERIRAAHGR